MLIVTAAEMARLDRAAIEDFGIPGIVLMENAARGAARFFTEVIPDLPKRRLAVVAGSGNNAGDGFVLARLFAEQGARVEVICLKPPSRLRGDALTNFQILERLQVPIRVWDPAQPFDLQFRPIAEAQVLIDAILGTGLNSPVTGLYRQVIEAMNGSGRPILAVDIPSGLDATSGRPLGAAVRAVATATFGAATVGQVQWPGEDQAGRLQVIDIGIPRQALAAAGIQRWFLDRAELRQWFSPRPPDTHKGRAGHVAVLAGSPGKTGAATLACLGAARVGAGLVTHLVPRSLNPIMEVKLTEAMTLPLEETAGHSVAPEALPEILEFLEGKQVLAAGPGISLDPGTEQLLGDLVTQAPCPLVLDADALTLISRRLEILAAAAHPLIITPHPGEMARLTHTTSAAVQADRIAFAAEFSRAHRTIVVLKGHRTVIAAPDGRLAVNGSGNPAMACGGMGDVLTGMIAGWLAQGYEPFTAACLGVYVHGAAADLRAGRGSLSGLGPGASRGLLAGDLLDAIGPVIADLEQDHAASGD